MQLRDRADLLETVMISGYGGAVVPDWDNATATPIATEIRPKRADVAESASAALTWLDCYVRPNVDLSQDRTTIGGRAVRIRWRGTDYDPEGLPVLFTAGGRGHHQRVVLTAVTTT